MYKHILVPTDGSDLAGKGVQQGLALAKALGAKVTVVTATEPFPVSGFALGAGWVPSGADMQEFSAAQKEDAEKILAAVKAEAAKAGVDADLVHVPDQRAADAILEAAKVHKAGGAGGKTGPYGHSECSFAGSSAAAGEILRLRFASLRMTYWK